MVSFGETLLLYLLITPTKPSSCWHESQIGDSTHANLWLDSTKPWENMPHHVEFWVDGESRLLKLYRSFRQLVIAAQSSQAQRSNLWSFSTCQPSPGTVKFSEGFIDTSQQPQDKEESPVCMKLIPHHGLHHLMLHPFLRTITVWQAFYMWLLTKITADWTSAFFKLEASYAKQSCGLSFLPTTIWPIQGSVIHSLLCDSLQDRLALQICPGHCFQDIEGSAPPWLKPRSTSPNLGAMNARCPLDRAAAGCPASEAAAPSANSGCSSTWL